MTESVLWRTVIVDAVVWKYHAGRRKCEARHGDVTVVADTWTVLGITEDEFANLVYRRQLNIKSKYICRLVKAAQLQDSKGRAV